MSLWFHTIKLSWYGIRDNEEADECAVIVSSLDETMACNYVLTPLVIVDKGIYDRRLRKFQSYGLQLNLDS